MDLLATSPTVDSGLPPEPRLETSQSGATTLAYGAELLEDHADPAMGARAFIQPGQLDGVDHVVLFGLGLGYRPARLIELGVAHPVVYEPCPDILSLDAPGAPPLPSDATLVTTSEELHAHLLSVSKTGERTVLLTPPTYQRCFPEEHAEVCRIIEEVQGLVLLKRNSVEERAAMLTERAIENLPRLTSVPFADSLGRPLEGTPAFVVSAGPSLDNNRALLREAGTRGAVFVVNTAAPAVAALETPIDVLVAIEALDVSEPLGLAAPFAKGLALDLTGGSPNFDVDVPRKLAFLADASQYRSLAESLGHQTLAYGGSVATAAFALAYHLGADPIVLLGQDLAYTDGRGYASDTLYAGTTVRREGKFLVIDRVAKWDETTRAGGLNVPAKVRPAMSVKAWGGGAVDSTHELTLFRRWFEMAAREIGGGVRLVNATEGGASIAGFEEVALAELLAELPARSDTLFDAWDAAPVIEAATVERVARRLSVTAQRIARAVEKVRKAGKRGRRVAQAHAEDEVRAAAKACPLAESHATPALLPIVEDLELDEETRAKRTWSVIHGSATKVASLARRVIDRVSSSKGRKGPQGKRRRARHPSRRQQRRQS